MISVEGVTKWFGDVVALSDVSFEVGPGVTSLLGPNGAGKSTALRVICGLTGPSRGKVRVLGHDPRTVPSLGGRLGLVPQQEALPETLSAVEFVAVVAGLGKVDRPKAAAEAALRSVGLDPGLRRRLRTYSKGMRQRVKIAQALVGEPEVLVLDEPLNGLDPRQRLAMIELFRRIGDQGRCVLVSSHVLDEVERWGSDVLVLGEGRLVAEGDFRAIRELLDDRPHRIRVVAAGARRLAGGLIDAGLASGVQVESPEAVVLETTEVADLRRAIPRIAAEGGLRLREVTPLDDDLESVFRYLVGRGT